MGARTRGHDGQEPPQEQVLGGPRPSSASVRKVTCLTPSLSPPRGCSGSPCPHYRRMPAPSNLAGGAEMSASSAASGPTPAGFVGTKQQAVAMSQGPLEPPCMLQLLAQCK